MFHQASSRPHSKCSKHGSHEDALQGLLTCLHAEYQKKRKFYRALLFVTGYEPELSENCGECSMQSTSIITCENPRREPNVLKIALSHFKIIIRVQTLLHPVPSTPSGPFWFAPKKIQFFPQSSALASLPRSFHWYPSNLFRFDCMCSRSNSQLSLPYQSPLPKACACR